MDLPGLAARLTTAARQADPLQRYRALRDLAPDIKTAIAAAQDAAIAEARAAGTPEDQVAEQSGVSVSEVRRRVTAHGKRTGAGRRPGRPAKP
ncbi:hypothetical protein [Micromonospora sp. WMMD1082]|uniref:hypothetical protein n=1 Tax=Micromonospora sp. WMMD1082 TaxID=3016104 RepID=UPI002416B615|nr:hypothetical protein [Micromonospora sp. WMMD1082]MDG4796230.1 hypothetical protein [Micromonospora sp. WMMD1082]